MNKPGMVSGEFATVMQQLSAEAKKSIPASPNQSARSTPSPALPETIENRLQELERSLSKKLDDLASAVARTRSNELMGQLGKIVEELAVIRNTETVNQRLFDSLHDELLKYRDNFVHESLQKPFIHDLVHLFDDLSVLATQLRTSAQEQKKRGQITQWRDNLDNAIHSLVEVLHRLEVTEIEQKETVDRALHRVVSYEPTDFPEEDGRIVMRLKRGFSWRGTVIRPEEVIAKRYG
ncbi:MAG TPA: nucleotide exchange factor GrpE [Chthoniobacterales bacterium]|jgi:molecular chaperone GrpE (heat shock protein)